MDHLNRSPRPPAQVLEDIAKTVLHLSGHASEQIPSEQLLAAATYAERVAQTLTYAPVMNPADRVLREAGDVALGRMLVRSLNPSLETHCKPLVKTQLRAARMLVHGCLDLIERPETAELMSAAGAVGEFVALAGSWQPPADTTVQVRLGADQAAEVDRAVSA